MHAASFPIVLIATLLLSASAPGATQERPLLTRQSLAEVVIADFANGIATARPLHPQTAIRAAAGSLEADYPAREDSPAVLLRTGTPIDLTGMDALRFALENATGERVDASLSLSSGAKDAPRAVYDLPLDPGSNSFIFPLWTILDERGGVFDRSRISEVRLTVKRHAHPVTLRVAKIAALKLFVESSRLRFFDFGDGAVAPGAAAVRADTTYDATRGYGIIDTGGVAAHTWQPAFDLLGDGLTGDRIEFRIDLPDGDYEAQAVAFGANWLGARTVSYRITADGAAVVDERITPERFRSYELQYYGADIFFDPRKTLFDQYHRGYFAPHRFEVRAHQGNVTLIFEKASPRALWIYPKERASDGRAVVDGCFSEEGQRLWLSHARVRDHAPQQDAVQPSEADRARGYLLFSRDPQLRVYPDQAPRTSELIPSAGLTVACAGGEFEPLTVVIRPLQDLGVTSIVCTAPALAGLTSPIEVRPFVVKCVPTSVEGMWYEAVPTLLYPYCDRELNKDWNCQYWVTLHVPPGTPGGSYACAITITPTSGAKTVVPVTVTVRPFDLPKTSTECSMWNCGPWSNHQIGAFPTDRELGDHLLDVETKDMAEHGLNGYMFGTPEAGELDRVNRRLPLNFDRFDRIAAAVERNGMTGRHIFEVMNLANYRLLNHGVTEFSPEFNEIYVGIMTQLRDWTRSRNVRGVLQVTDECRETEINDWNRNRVDTYKHLRLARRVDGLQTMVTLMADTDCFNRPYTPLIPLMDVVASHSWLRSDDQIYLTTVEKMADFWTYNNGFTRFAYGFYLWKSKALGQLQWVYSWESTSPHIPVLMGADSSAAYAVPGGYLDTLKYENLREGIDDHRYIELLLSTIGAAPSNAPALADARKFLDTLEKFLPAYPSDSDMITGAEAGASWDESAQTAYFGEWRAQLSEYIAALRENRVAKRLDPAWSMFPHALVAEQKTLVCRLVDTAPTVDGMGDDAVWSTVPEAGDFLDLARGVRATMQTTVKLACDGKRLYALIVATEPKYGELKAYATARDGDCWADDAVELFLDTKHDQATYKHIVVNCLGTVEDADTRDPIWNADIVTAVSRGKGSWTVEMSIGLASLGGQMPKEGVAWGANVCRDRQPLPPEASSWAFVGTSFHNPKAFGTLTFAK